MELQMKDQITFILSTDKRNYLFTLPFMFFAAKYNKNSTFDLHIYKGCDTSYLQSGIDFIKMCFSCNVHVIDIIESTTPPQLYRFLVDPVSQTQYAYCCDIDIMICEDILPFHIKKLQNGKYCYDNEIRQYSDPSKMSGLHFCTQSWYTYQSTQFKTLMQLGSKETRQTFNIYLEYVD